MQDMQKDIKGRASALTFFLIKNNSMKELSELELIARLEYAKNVYDHQKKKGWYKIANKQWDIIWAIEAELRSRA